MLSYSCLSSRHLPTRLPQLCPLRLPSSTLQPFVLDSSVPHTAARHITATLKQLHWLPTSVPHTAARHITATLKQLHWLPIHVRIAFKIFLLMYHIYSGTSPTHMSSRSS